MSDQPSAVPAPAWDAFDRALDGSAGYRNLMASHGIAGRPASWTQVPFTDKHAVFGDISWPEWVIGDGIAAASELVTSSGQSGVFSLGVALAAERAELQTRVDGLLTAFGAGPGSPTLLVNCLPMGIAVPTRLATLISPSTHFEMALEALAVLAAHFDRVVLLGEPLFLKELGERRREMVGPSPLPCPLLMFTGGEWLAESLRADICRLFGIRGPERGALVCSMGAAELGLHVLFETPALAGARAALAADPPARAALFGSDPGFCPSLFCHDPARFLLEARSHADGTSTLVATTLGEPALPLIRYDLGDLIQVIEPAELAALTSVDAEALGEGPVFALFGRPADGPGPRPEQIKERLFADRGLARALSGRFYLAQGTVPVLHLERRGTLEPEPAAIAALGTWLERLAGQGALTMVYAPGAYPYHLAGDWQHKPRYAGELGWGRRS